MSFSLVDITPEFSRTYSCSKLESHPVIVLSRDLLIVYEACPEGSGGGNIAKLVKENDTWSKTDIVGSSNYNRTFLAKTRFFVKSIGKVGIASGYGEAFEGAECGANGDLWIFFEDGEYKHFCSPYGNTTGGNIYDVIFDIVTKKLYSGGHGVGDRIQRWDPLNGFEDDWVVANGIRHSFIFPTNIDKIFIVTAGDSCTNYEVYTASFDILRKNWKETTYLIDHSGVTKLGTLQNLYRGQRAHFASFDFIYINGRDANDNPLTARIDAKGNISYFQYDLKAVIYGRYLLTYDEQNNVINIFDEDFNSVSTISFDFSTYHLASGAVIDPPFFVQVNKSTFNYKVVAFALNGHVPFIEFDPTANKFRVVDFLTGEVITAYVGAIFSKLAGGMVGPIIAEPSYYVELTVSDWTPLPTPPFQPAFINLYVYDIQG